MPYKTPISFSGNLTKNPELTFTRGGIAQCKFGVAKNTRKQNPQTKEWENGEPTFFNCTAWEFNRARGHRRRELQHGAEGSCYRCDRADVVDRQRHARAEEQLAGYGR